MPRYKYSLNLEGEEQNKNQLRILSSGNIEWSFFEV